MTRTIEHFGGIERLMQRFEEAALHATMRPSPIPQPAREVTAECLIRVLGAPWISEFAARLKLSPQTFAIRLAVVLPWAVGFIPDSSAVGVH